MKTGLRSSRDLAVLAVAIVAAFAIFACSLPAVTGAPIVKPANEGESEGACLAGIHPGITTKNEVVASLGYPLATVPEEAGEIMQYASAVYGQLNSIMIRNEVVTLVTVVQAADKPLRWSEIKAQLGEPAFTAYTNYQQGSRVYVFPDRGRAFTADEAMDAVFVQQCFASMSLEEYKAAYGNALPAEDPFTK